jgi:hypothetical protein
VTSCLCPLAAEIETQSRSRAARPIGAVSIQEHHPSSRRLLTTVACEKLVQVAEPIVIHIHFGAQHRTGCGIYVDFDNASTRLRPDLDLVDMTVPGTVPSATCRARSRGMTVLGTPSWVNVRLIAVTLAATMPAAPMPYINRPERTSCLHCT